jgi:hypothetical protein
MHDCTGNAVVPAQAGTQGTRGDAPRAPWIPACAGMTGTARDCRGRRGNDDSLIQRTRQQSVKVMHALLARRRVPA